MSEWKPSLQYPDGSIPASPYRLYLWVQEQQWQHQQLVDAIKQALEDTDAPLD